MAFQDLRKSRRWMSAEEIRLLLFIALVLSGLLALNIVAARSLPGGEWFHLRWSGARAFLFEGIEPYSTEVAVRTQAIVYGGPAESDEYPYVLNDPFPILLLYTPLALIPDFTVARGVWMFLSEAALVGSVLIILNLTEWQPPRWLLVLLLAYGLFGYFSLNALISGTPAVILNFLYLAILLALRSGSDEVAGVLLFLVSYQWEVGGVFFTAVMILVFMNHRWRVLAGFGMALMTLLAITFLVYPGWALPYVRAVLSDWLRGANLTFGSIAAFWFPGSRLPIDLTVASVLGVLVFVEWLGAIQLHFRRLLWGASLVLAVTPFMGLPIFPSNYVILLLPVILLLGLVWERWKRRRIAFSLLILGVALLVPFWLHYQKLTVGGRLYNDLLLLLPPAATVISLYWMRWWVTRTPRPWVEQLELRR